MNCPACQKELPENHSGRWCPFCSRKLPARMRQGVFFAVLLTPAVITMLVAMLAPRERDDVPVGMGLIGGATAGIICGVMLGRRLGKTGTGRLLIGIFASLFMAVVAIALCCGGCAIGFSSQSR